VEARRGTASEAEVVGEEGCRDRVLEMENEI
jgi:hypothetical protein